MTHPPPTHVGFRTSRLLHFDVVGMERGPMLSLG